MTTTLRSGSPYRPRWQRRLRLAFSGYTLLVTAVLGGLSIVFVYVVEDAFFTSALQSEVERQEAHLAMRGGLTAPALPYVRLYRPGEDLPSDLARQYGRHPDRDEFAGEDGRHYHLRHVGSDGSLLVAEVSGQLVVRSMRDELMHWVLAVGSGLVLLALVLGHWLAQRISAPLTTLAERVAGSAPDALPDNLSRGLATDEVGELARRLDHLHGRTRALIRREQAFTADASHELRTPLTVIGLAADRLQATATAEQQPLLRSIQTAAWQLQQTVDMLLALAREAPSNDAAEPEHALRPMLEELVIAYAPWLDRQAAEVELHVPPSIVRRWTPAMTQLLVGHLLANAITHAQIPRVVIEADASELRICNPSLPPPAELLGADAAGRQPGVRGTASAGQGLGLSIVRRLANRHGLALELQHRDGQTMAVLRAAGSEGPIVSKS